MNIRILYEAGIVLFWLLFAYLTMDKFLFRGQLGEICFGPVRRRMAKMLRGISQWFDPMKEERKKGKKKVKETPSPPSIRKVEKKEKTNDLVVSKSYGTRHEPPTTATNSKPLAGKEKADTFTIGNEKRPSTKTAQVPVERIPDLFRDKRVEEWRATSEGNADNRQSEPDANKSEEVDTDELNEELEDLNCAREDYSESAQGIGPEEMDLIIDLCNGKDIPISKRLSLLRAIHHIKDTQIHRSIIESINGSDNRISNFLDEAEKMGEVDSETV